MEQFLSWPSEGSNHVDTLILDFLPPELRELWESTFLPFEPPSLLCFVMADLANQYNTQIFFNDGDKLDLPNSKQIWESSGEFSLFWINTQAIPIFLFFSSFLSHQAAALHGGICPLDSADMPLFFFVTLALNAPCLLLMYPLRMPPLYQVTGSNQFIQLQHPRLNCEV